MSTAAPAGPGPRARVAAAVAALVAAAAVGYVPASAARAASEPPPDPTSVTDQAISASIQEIQVTEAVLPIRVGEAVVPLRTESRDGSGVSVAISSDLLFAFDSAELTATARAQLADIATRISGATGTVAVHGYTDSTGTPAYNIMLSQRRANAVADVLRPRAPRGVLVSATGHGAANPVAANTSPDGTDNALGRAQNRRVTIVYRTA